MKELLKRYAELKIKEKDIANLISELAPVILIHFKQQGLDKVDSPFGKFIKEIRKTWKFSHVVERLAEELEGQKNTEKATGKATFEEKSFLKFFEPKE